MPVLVPVRRVAKLCNPLCNPWTGEPFTVEDVRKAMAEGRLNASAYRETTIWTRRQHIERIAFLAVHGWAAAIEIDVGVPSLGHHVRWPITDGNHRVAAALVRRDTRILASVGGSLDYAQELFGVDVTEPFEGAFV